MKLHLGCWHRRLDGYVNIDIKHENADVHADIQYLPYENNTIDEIYASHVLEHFGRHEFLAVLKEWNRVLKPGGSVYIAVPDIESAFKYYEKHKDLRVLYGLFWGGQRDEYDYHKFGFTFDTLSKYLNETNFENPRRYNTFEYLPKDFDDYSKAHLPHMDFENGQLLSLNITATKRLTRCHT
jgi:predicted SAM-dependent methyltransferase